MTVSPCWTIFSTVIVNSLYYQCTISNGSTLLCCRKPSSHHWDFTSIDLVDTYFHIPIHRGYRKCLRFQTRDTIYQFWALLFGLPPVPWVFTKNMAEIKMQVHVMGINLCQYLDDWLIYSPSHDQCPRDTVQISDTRWASSFTTRSRNWSQNRNSFFWYTSST